MREFWKKARIAAAFSVGLLALQFVAPDAKAQDKYPSRTISFICASPAGSDSDTILRYLAEKMSVLTGATIIVENKPGAGANIAAEYTARANPDGYTVLIHAGSALAGNMHLFAKPPIDVTKDLRTIATIHQQGFMVTVAGNSPYKTLPDLTAAMKAKGADATYGYGTTTARVLGELYRTKAGLTAVPVAYKESGDTLNDMMSGTLDYAIHNPVLALSQAREGRLQVLGVGLKDRLTAAPDVPTMTEGGIEGVDLPSWFAVFVPAATPEPIVEQLNGWFGEVLNTEETRKFFNGLGGDVFISTPAASQALLEQTVKDWEGYVEVAQIPKQ